MFEGLNKYGPPRKYAILGFLGGIIGGVLIFVFGLSDDPTLPWTTPLAGAAGGYIGGVIRRRQGKSN